MCSTAAFTVTASSDPQPRWLASSCSNALVLIRSSRKPNSCSCFNSVSHFASTTAEMGSTDVTDLSDAGSLTISWSFFLVSTTSFSSVTTLQSSSVLLCSSVLRPSSLASLAAASSVWEEAFMLLSSTELLSASKIDEATENVSAAAAVTSLLEFCTASSSMASSIACTQTSSVLPMTSAILFPSASEKKESSLLSPVPDFCSVLTDSSSLASGLRASAGTGVPSSRTCSSDLGLAASLTP
mmetsp:Transcript_1276/g.2047  ORF Transcript_1276/g.2047 Transcript_1276/m.2047 type:complete len:241 (+) Transcript_1276:95-817(+)